MFDGLKFWDFGRHLLAEYVLHATWKISKTWHNQNSENDLIMLGYVTRE